MKQAKGKDAFAIIFFLCSKAGVILAKELSSAQGASPTGPSGRE